MSVTLYDRASTATRQMALSKKHQDAATAAELERKRAEKQDKLCKIKSSLTSDQMRAYRQHFELFDLNGDGVINARELRKVSRQMGYRLDDSQIEVSTLPRLLLPTNASTVSQSTR